MDHEVARLVERAQAERSKQRNRFLDLLDAGEVPKDRLGWLAGELYLLVGSDRRSLAFLASRFPSPPAGDLFLTMAQAEGEALRLLLEFAGALGLGEQDLRAYEPMARAQSYPAYLAQTALSGTSSGMALALLANVAESGGNYARAADALRSRYGFSEDALGHFRFFADTPQSVLDQAAATVTAGIAGGESPQDAVRTARMVNAYEILFWESLADGLGEG
jgi:thiaminase